ncbi:MAG: cupin domain-containing protein, partial [Gemmatimonadaceae bacterium]
LATRYPLLTTDRSGGLNRKNNFVLKPVFPMRRNERSLGLSGPQTANQRVAGSSVVQFASYCQSPFRLASRGFMETHKGPDDFPYATHLDIRYPALEVVDVPRLIDAVKARWYNQTLCRVNDSVVRLGVMQGEYHWHKHDDLDEFFYVVEGKFVIDLEDRTIELAERQGFVVPKGMVHRTRAPERAVILMVEGAGIIPTGD